VTGNTWGVSYRAGQFDQAVQHLLESEEVIPGWEARVVNRLVLALAYHRLDQADKARHYLKEAVHWIDVDMPKVAVGDRSLYPHDWLACQLLRREAEDLMKEPGP
jgi:hypothetical protein